MPENGNLCRTSSGVINTQGFDYNRSKIQDEDGADLFAALLHICFPWESPFRENRPTHESLDVEA
jgi:hypothetical protein